MNEPVVPVEIVRRVRDHEIRPRVTDQLIEPPHELVHREIFDATRALVVEHDQARADQVRRGTRFSAALLVRRRDRDDGHRDLGALGSQPCEQAAGADLEIIGVGSERQHAAILVLEDPIHAATRRAPLRLSALRSPQLNRRSRNPRCASNPREG